MFFPESPELSASGDACSESAHIVNGDVADKLNGDVTDKLNGDVADKLNGDVTDKLNGDVTDKDGETAAIDEGQQKLSEMISNES